MTLALHRRFVTNIVATVQFFAILGFVFSTVGIYVREDLRVTFEFALVGIAVAATIVLLVYNKRKEAATAIWLGAVALAFAACDLTNLVGMILCLAFSMFSLWLMRLIDPASSGNRSS